MSTRSGRCRKTSWALAVICVIPRDGRSSSPAWARWVTAQATRLVNSGCDPLPRIQQPIFESSNDSAWVV